MIENAVPPHIHTRQQFVAPFDLSGATVASTGLVDRLNDLNILSIDLLYTVDTSTHTQDETILVGTADDPDHYCDITVEISKAAGVVTAQTLLSTDVLTANTPLIIKKSAGTGTSNTGEVSVVVNYDFNKTFTNVYF